MGGVQVDRTALGAPYALFGASFAPTFGTENLDLGSSTDPTDPQIEWAAQCFPTMVQNPVQCETTGNVIIGKNEVTVDTANCSVTTPIYGVDPQNEGASAARACTAGRDVGTAAIVIGSVNQHAPYLATAMFDNNFNQSQSTYSVACEVDISSSVAFRLLNYSRVNSSSNAPGSSFVVTQGDTPACEANLTLPQVLTETALAAGVAGS